MAEAFLRHFGGDRYEVESAGLEPRPVNPLVVEVMMEEGFDWPAKRPTACSTSTRKAGSMTT